MSRKILATIVFFSVLWGSDFAKAQNVVSNAETRRSEASKNDGPSAKAIWATFLTGRYSPEILQWHVEQRKDFLRQNRSATTNFNSSDSVSTALARSAAAESNGTRRAGDSGRRTNGNANQSGWRNFEQEMALAAIPNRETTAKNGILNFPDGERTANVAARSNDENGSGYFQSLRRMEFSLASPKSEAQIAEKGLLPSPRPTSSGLARLVSGRSNAETDRWTSEYADFLRQERGANVSYSSPIDSTVDRSSERNLIAASQIVASQPQWLLAAQERFGANPYSSYSSLGTQYYSEAPQAANENQRFLAEPVASTSPLAVPTKYVAVLVPANSPIFNVSRQSLLFDENGAIAAVSPNLFENVPEPQNDVLDQRFDSSRLAVRSIPSQIVPVSATEIRQNAAFVSENSPVSPASEASPALFVQVSNDDETENADPDDERFLDDGLLNKPRKLNVYRPQKSSFSPNEPTLPVARPLSESRPNP